MVIRTLSTSATIDLCAELGPHGISSAVAVQEGAWLASPHFEQYLEPPMVAPQVSQPLAPVLHSSTQEPPPFISLSLVYLRAFPAGQLRHLSAPAVLHEAHEGSPLIWQRAAGEREG